MIIDLIVAITGVILYAMHAKEAELGLRIIKSIGIFIVCGAVANILICGLIGMFLPTQDKGEYNDLYVYDTKNTGEEIYLRVKYGSVETRCQYVIQDDNNTKMEKPWLQNVKIIEGDFKPHMIIYKAEFEEWYYYLFANNIFNNFYDTRYEFYLPKDNIEYQIR